jgi:hypothetical protein
MTTIYILRRDHDGYENIDDIASFNNETSAQSYQAAYAVMHPEITTLISTEKIYNGEQEFAPFYHRYVAIPTIGNTSLIGDNEIIKSLNGDVKIEGIVTKDVLLPRSRVDFNTTPAGSYWTQEGLIHKREPVMTISAYGYSEEEVIATVNNLIAEIRVAEKSGIKATRVNLGGTTSLL